MKYVYQIALLGVTVLALWLSNELSRVDSINKELEMQKTLLYMINDKQKEYYEMRLEKATCGYRT